MAKNKTKMPASVMAAWIGGGCVVLAAIIAGAVQLLKNDTPPVVIREIARKEIDTSSVPIRVTPSSVTLSEPSQVKVLSAISDFPDVVYDVWLRMRIQPANVKPNQLYFRPKEKGDLLVGRSKQVDFLGDAMGFTGTDNAGNPIQLLRLVALKPHDPLFFEVGTTVGMGASRWKDISLDFAVVGFDRSSEGRSQSGDTVFFPITFPESFQITGLSSYVVGEGAIQMLLMDSAGEIIDSTIESRVGVD